MSTASAPTSVIHDIGYKPYTGPRQGRAQIVRALYVHSLRSIFGLGRGPKAKIVPWFVILAMLIPAAVNVYAASSGKSLVVEPSVLGYHLFLFAVLFVAAAAPELMSRDLRHHTLPLYFSRPLRRFDYPMAKMLALFSALFAVELLPILVTYLGQVASDTTGHQIWLDTKADFPGLFTALLQSLLFTVISLLIASTTGRRVIATGVIAILFLVTTAISSVMANALGKSWADHTISCVEPQSTQKQIGTGDSFTGFPGAGKAGPGGPGPVMVQPDPSNSVSALCPGFDLQNDNINDLQISPDAQKPGYNNVTMDYQTPVYATVAKIGGMTDPTSLVEGIRIWTFNSTDNQIPNPSPLGPAYAVEFLVLVVGCGGLLTLRYRKVSVS